MKKFKYRKSLPREMYSYFISYDDTQGAPSFQKFAKEIGVTTEELLSMRQHKRFDESYRECSEIRRDYLIDRALSKRFDASFVKFLVGEEGDTRDGEVEIRLEVVE